MNLAFTVVTTSIKSLTRILCNIDDTQLINVPEHGPLIIACNHVNFMDAPLVYTHLQPRKLTGFAKAETWQNPVIGLLFDLWGAIPVQRGQADTSAFRSGLEALRQGKILGIAPEGTRSGHGRLQRGLPGIVILAQYSEAPILPLVYYGGEKLHDNINRLKRTDFNIRVGKLFKLIFPEGKLDREVRIKMVDEIMYQMASLLPEEYRGHYSNLTKLTTNYINFV
ncbi:MAG: lysophospholipid acyltransferase family protein [Anaerolineales bacterium]